MRIWWIGIDGIVGGGSTSKVRGQSNERREPTTTLFGVVSVGYHSELGFAITFN